RAIARGQISGRWNFIHLSTYLVSVAALPSPMALATPLELCGNLDILPAPQREFVAQQPAYLLSLWRGNLLGGRSNAQADRPLACAFCAQRHHACDDRVAAHRHHLQL